MIKKQDILHKFNSFVFTIMMFNINAYTKYLYVRINIFIKK